MAIIDTEDFMPILNFVEQQRIFKLFDIHDGMIFYYFTKNGKHSHDKTRFLIQDACNIDIKDNPDYNFLSDQECIEKIFSEGDSTKIISLINILVEYFDFLMEPNLWCLETSNEFYEVKQIVNKIDQDAYNTLPSIDEHDMALVKKDIEHNMRTGNPELAIDRLHTYATVYLRKICILHSIEIKNNNNCYYPLDTLIGSLMKYYKKGKYCDNEFNEVAVKYSISVFNKFNSLRNNNSAAHSNNLLNKEDAEFAVKIVTNMLEYIDKIEEKLRNACFT